jgi:hypothetical protein
VTLVIAIVTPLADHFFDGGLGDSATLPPLARLRRGRACVSASAVEMRWIVDQRASSRPFSIREMSACGIPLRLESSACVQPSSIVVRGWSRRDGRVRRGRSMRSCQ